jgi:Tol biopolymer transport system component
VPIAGGPIVDLAGPMARGFGVDAGHGLTFDSGGTRVVYLADPEGDGITELYSVLLDASQLPIRLNHTLPTGDVPAYQVSPSSPFVAYWAFDGTTSTIRCVPVDRSSEPVVLRRGWYSLPALSSGGFRFAPDGQHVVFSEWVPPYDIFSVPIDGSATPVRLTPSFVPEGSVLHGDFDFSALGLVLYIAEAEQFTFEVYAAPVDASAPPAPRSADLPQMTVGDVTGFELGPDGREVAFEASGVSLDEGIYVTRTDGRGAAPRLVVGPHGAFRVHPDGQRLLYASEIPGDSSLYGVRVDGQEPAVRLGAFESEETHRPFQLTPDGARALFVASSFALSELRSVATDGSGTTVLARNLYSSDGVDIDPAGHMALFRTAGSTPRDLYAVPVDGSRPAVVLGPIQPRQSSSYALQFSPDGSRVAFNGDTRLFAARLATGAPAVPLPTRLAVSSLVFSADSSHVDYVDDFLMRKRDEIYTVAADGGAAHALVQVQDTADVSTMQLARNGSYLYYIADRDTDQIFELYRVAGTGGASTRLNGNLVAGGDVDRFLLTPTRVVYAADQDANDVRELYSVPRDGSAAPIRVSAPLVADGNVTDFWVESTGTLVVYLADAEQDEEFDLYAARTDGTGTAHRLHPRPVPGGDVVSVQLDPEHALVVFRGDLDEDDAIELYASNLNPLIRRAELR